MCSLLLQSLSVCGRLPSPSLPFLSSPTSTPLSQIPDKVFKGLPLLQSLSVCANRLVGLPESISVLTAMQSLRLDGNCIAGGAGDGAMRHGEYGHRGMAWGWFGGGGMRMGTPLHIPLHSLPPLSLAHPRPAPHPGRLLLPHRAVNRPPPPPSHITGLPPTLGDCTSLTELSTCPPPSHITGLPLTLGDAPPSPSCQPAPPPLAHHRPAPHPG